MSMTSPSLHGDSPRFFVREGYRIRVVLTAGSHNINGSLRDISTRGFWFDAKAERVRGDVPSNVRLLSDPQGQLLESVCEYWSRESQKGSMTLGYRFSPEIPTERLVELQDIELVARPEFHRHSIEIFGKAKCRTSLGQFNVELLDVSGGGICFCCERSLEQGQQIDVSLQDDVGTFVLETAVRWAVPNRDGYTVGCELKNSCEEASARLLSMIGISKPPSPTSAGCGILHFFGLR